MKPKQPIRLVLDWDGTITLSDTLSTIASIGYAKNAHQNLPPWSYFTESYMADYSAHAASYQPQKSGRKSIDSELAWLESIVIVERASIERVEAAGILANVTKADIQAAAVQAVEKQEVRLRSGLVELLESMAQFNGTASIISVNWSGLFITESLKAAAVIKGHRWPFEGIWANEIEFGTKGNLNRVFGKENRGIWTAKDKSRVFRDIMGTKDQFDVSVYVGDSLTDLDCLMSADVGICVRDEPLTSEQKSLVEALERLKIPCNWIRDYKSSAEFKKDSPVMVGKTLWWARDFRDVANSCLFEK